MTRSVPKTLDAMLDHAADHAMKLMREHGEHMSLCVGFTPDDKIIMMLAPMNFPRNKEGIGKDRLALMLRKQLLERGCDRYTFTTEAWFSEMVNKGEHPGPPSEAPDCIDALQVLAATADAAVARSYLVYKTKWDGKRHIEHPTGKHIRLERLRDSDLDTRQKGASIGGRWATLLHPDFDVRGVCFIASDPDTAAVAKLAHRLRRAPTDAEIAKHKTEEALTRKMTREMARLAASDPRMLKILEKVLCEQAAERDGEMGLKFMESQMHKLPQYLAKMAETGEFPRELRRPPEWDLLEPDDVALRMVQL